MMLLVLTTVLGYELKTAADGRRYITPGKDAKPEVYNPLKEAPAIVLDALNVGMLMMGRKPEAEVEKAIMEFITRYGLLGLMTAVSMFRASGALEWLTRLCAPALDVLGIPAELTPLLLIRPISGSGALAVATDLMRTHGPDSYIGRVAAVMLGSTETTFYTIAVYFSAAGITRTRYAVPAALCADLVGFLASAWAVGVVFG